MSDWIKDNKYTVLFIVLLLTVFFFSVIKPYVDKSDKIVLDGAKQEVEGIRQEMSTAMDTLIVIGLDQLDELKKINNGG